jgi:flagellar protein FlaG
MAEIQLNTRIEPAAVPSMTTTGRAPVMGGSASAAAVSTPVVSELSQMQSRAQAARSAQGALSESLQKRLQEALQALNQQMADSGRTLGFSYDPAIQSSVVKVIDQSSGALIRQIPAQAVVDVAHSIDALKGVLFNQNT